MNASAILVNISGGEDPIATERTVCAYLPSVRDTSREMSFAGIGHSRDMVRKIEYYRGIGASIATLHCDQPARHQGTNAGLEQTRFGTHSEPLISMMDLLAREGTR